MPNHGLQTARVAALPALPLSPPLGLTPLAGARPIGTGIGHDIAEWPAEALVNLHDLGKGVRWALAIEGVAALTIYAAWQLWRLWL